MKYFNIFVIAVVLAILRGAQPLHQPTGADVYKDVAHLFVAGLFTAAWITKKPFYWAAAFGLTGVELINAWPLISKALGLS